MSILDVFNVSESRLHFSAKPTGSVSNIEQIKRELVRLKPSMNKEQMNSARHLDMADYKDYLINAKSNKSNINQLMANQGSLANGIGRLQTSQIDHFVLTRKIQNPEMVFGGENFYQKDLAYQWKLSPKNECYIC